MAGRRRFWGKNGGASIDYLRFSIFDWLETLVFGRKTRVKPSIMSAMGLRIGVFRLKNAVGVWETSTNVEKRDEMLRKVGQD